MQPTTDTAPASGPGPSYGAGPAGPAAVDSAYARRLLLLFGLVYFSQGLGQNVGVIDQPIKFYFKDALGLDAARTTEYLAITTIPWTIKPIYGLVGDFVPLLGYRRKSWLLVANLTAVAGFLWLAGLTEPAMIAVALLLTAFGTAASDVIVDAIMVESGRQSGRTAEFQSVQWLWSSIGLVAASLVGGVLCHVFPPGTALHAAALLTLAAPLAVIVAAWLIVREAPSRLELSALQATAGSLREALRSRVLWLVLAFLAFWNFSPSFGTPWYYHQTATLGFSQVFIGVLGAVAGAGGALGALAYWRHFGGLPLRRQLAFGIWTGGVGALLHTLLLVPSGASAAVAVGVAMLVGAGAMVALLATLTLAAKACPPRSEGFTFAALVSAMNGIAQIGELVGAELYTRVLGTMLPLILVSAAFTFACFLLLPLLERAGIGLDG